MTNRNSSQGQQKIDELKALIHSMSNRQARLFGCACAERVLPTFEEAYPNDDRPRRAIEVARQYADGEASEDELYAAEQAAYSAFQQAVSKREASGAAFTSVLAARLIVSDFEAATTAAVSASATVGHTHVVVDDWNPARDVEFSWQKQLAKDILDRS